MLRAPTGLEDRGVIRRGIGRTSGCRTSLVLVCASLLLGACAGGAGRAGDDDQVVVKFDDRRIEPAAARVARGRQVRWFSTSGDFGGRVVFPQNIESSSSCDGLGPGFHLIEGQYVSDFIQMDGRQVEIPCTLDPGRYAYEIRIYGVGFGGERDPAQVENRLRGELIVE
jgi:hypothetical protein